MPYANYGRAGSPVWHRQQRFVPVCTKSLRKGFSVVFFMDIFGDSGVSFLTRETLLRVKHGAEGRTIEKRGKDAKESGKHGVTGSFS